jgi:hypothetical protein
MGPIPWVVYFHHPRIVNDLSVKTVLALKSEGIVTPDVYLNDSPSDLGGVIMKAKKALKRLAKIEALMSNVTKRYSASAPDTRKVLQDAKAAVTRAMEAVGLQASTGTAKRPPVQHSKRPSKVTPELSKPKRKLSAAGRKAISDAAKKRWAAKRAETERPEPAVAKKAAVKEAVAKTAPVKVAVKKAAARKPQKMAAKTPEAVETAVQ